MTDEEVKRWDDWFALVGLKQGWEVIKEKIPRVAWENWATIIELNRISDATESKEVKDETTN